VSSALADRFVTTAPPGKDSINAITEIHAGRAPCPALLLCSQSFRPYYLNCPWNLRTAMCYIHFSISELFSKQGIDLHKYDLVKWVLYANIGFYLVASDNF